MQDIKKTYRIRWITVAVCAIGFAVVTVLVALGKTTAWDDGILLAIASVRSAGLTTLFQALTYFGSWEAIVIICLLSIAYHKRGRCGESLAVVIVSTAVITTLFRMLMKGIIARPRPDVVSHLVNEGGFSFPSGHAIASMSVYMVIFILLYENMEKGSKKNLLMTLSGIMAFLVGLTRLYLGVHYPTDVIGGWLAGTAFGLAILTSVQVLKTRSAEIQLREQKTHNHGRKKEKKKR